MTIKLDGTNGITNVNGTAAAPAETGTTSTNTGLSFGTNTVTVSTAGSARATFDASGNLGVGTTSPSYKLHVSGAVAGGAVWVGSVNTDATASSTGGFLGVASGVNNYFALYQVVGGSTTLQNSGAGGLYLNTVQAQPIIFLTNNTSRFTIGSSGEFGIGATPTYGTSGQVLKSGGTGAPPTWGTVTTSSPTILTYNSSSTWTKATDVPAGCTMAMIEVWSGGGGGSRSASSGQTCGGGGGAYNYIVIPISSLGATETVTVGAGGLGATVAGFGGTGGNSSFGTSPYITVYGGLGGDFNGSSPCGVGLFSTGRSGGGTTLSGKYNGVTTGYDGTTNFTYPLPSVTYGGNGAGYAGPTAAICIAGSSTFGGGGGGGGQTAAAQVAGTSTFGGNGGASAATPGAGTQPAGGGAGSTSANVNGAAGGAGRIKITMW